MTIEELTFTAFQQGREQSREESAAEIERLKALVMRAYAEGFGDAWAIADDHLNQVAEYGTCWDVSHARAALQPKEGQ